jgi:TolB-like protein
MKEIWPDTIVEENNLTVSMSTLRKTLGDNPGNPQFIETVPRRGYRFLPKVEISSERPAAEDVSPIETETTFQEEPIDSLAVLPMLSTGSDPDVEYLSQGITESITDMLSRIPKLRVLASSTVFRFIKKDVDPQAVGLQLNVRAVMTIRVMRLEDKLIIRIAALRTFWRFSMT